MDASLGEIVEANELWRGKCVPVSDHLHLVKNMKQRVRCGELALSPSGRPISGAKLAAEVPGLEGVAEPGKRGSMSVSEALKALNMRVAPALLDCRNIVDGNGRSSFRPKAHRQALEIAYAMFCWQYHELHGCASVPPERARGGEVRAFCDSDHLRRAMNLLVVIYFFVSDGEVCDLSRTSGTQEVELQFAGNRSFLRERRLD
jgi:hypothetical protein